MFGNGINCRSCKHYGGTISDGNILCMENGPLIDVSYCEKYKYEESGENYSENNETKTSNCLLCNYFSKHTSEKVKNFGECSKFPGRLYNGGKRNSCGFYKKRCTT